MLRNVFARETNQPSRGRNTRWWKLLLFLVGTNLSFRRNAIQRYAMIIETFVCATNFACFSFFSREKLKTPKYRNAAAKLVIFPCDSLPPSKRGFVKYSDKISQSSAARRSVSDCVDLPLLLLIIRESGHIVVACIIVTKRSHYTIVLTENEYPHA